MQRVSENYRKIRNTFRYVLGNLGDFDPQCDALPFEQLQAIDQYILRRTVEMSADVTRCYDEFAFHKIYPRIGGPPIGADGYLEDRRGPGSAAGPGDELYHGRGMGLPAQSC